MSPRIPCPQCQTIPTQLYFLPFCSFGCAQTGWAPPTTASQETHVPSWERGPDEPLPLTSLVVALQHLLDGAMELPEAHMPLLLEPATHLMAEVANQIGSSAFVSFSKAEADSLGKLETSQVGSSEDTEDDDESGFTH